MRSDDPPLPHTPLGLTFGQVLSAPAQLAVTPAKTHPRLATQLASLGVTPTVDMQWVTGQYA